MLKAKQVKESQMRELEERFHNVRDLVLMNVSKLKATDENRTRLDLRKKNIRLMLVKNTLARRVLDKMGIPVTGVWEGPTLVAWGGTSVAGLSKELEKAFKDNKNVQFKAAVADGQQVTFAQALKMPTREEAIGRVVALALSPASSLVSRLLGPASQVAGQIKSIAEKEEGAEAPAASAS